MPSPPTRLIQKQTTINLGGKVNLVLHLYKAGHTPQPIIAHIQSDNIVYAGDTLYSGRLIAIVPGGNIREWKQTYQYLKRFQDAVFIPGHGMPAHLSAFDKPTYAYLDLLDQHMSKMVEAGIDMQDAILRLDQSAFSELANFKELAGRNANLAYQEAERASFEN